MKYIDKRSYSIEEVAKYINSNSSSIMVFQTKNSNNPQKPLHQYWSDIKSPIDGRKLTSVKGYYVSTNGDEECVYAEFCDEYGMRYCYVKHPGKSISYQMKEDGVWDDCNNALINKYQSTKVGGSIFMEDLTKLNYDSVKEFNEAIEAFIEAIKRECGRMETGISSCQRHLQDEQSKLILRKANAAVLRIKDCVDPAVKINQKLVELLEALSSYGISN